MTDRLVERIPVYLSQEFAKSLHLIKSPLRDPTRPYDDVGPLQSTTYKLNAQVFEFQHGLNQMDAHYNANAEHHINTMTFQTRPNETRVNHVIGQRIENAYILHPVYKVHTLLPVFKHVDDIQSEYDNDLLGQVCFHQPFLHSFFPHTVLKSTIFYRFFQSQSSLHITLLLLFPFNLGR
jgi:hypothetical protein